MSTGKNDLPALYQRTYEPCKSQCYVCNKKYEKYILPIVHEGTIEFLGSSHFGKVLRDNKLSYDEPDAIINSLWDSDDWREKVFGKKTVAKYNVTAFFFQLIAARILGFEKQISTDSVYCVLCRDENDKCKYHKRRNWKGFEFRRKGGGNEIGRTCEKMRVNVLNYSFVGELAFAKTVSYCT